MIPPIDLITTRRSVLAKDLQDPGPDAEQLGLILRAAHRVPDHGKIGPWRFVILQGDARRTFGEEVAKIFAADNPEATDKLLSFQRELFLRAPLVIAVICSSVDHPKVPEWEQVLSVGAACQNILLAATSLGYGAQWLTEWYSYDRNVGSLLNMTASERVAGFIYIGSYSTKPDERVRPSLEERTTFWNSKG